MAFWGSDAALTALSYHISDVLGLSGNEKVVDVYARWIVAVVAHILTFRDWPAIDLPSRTMGQRVIEFSIAAPVDAPLEYDAP